jgi:gliding motility-associated-like protein
MKAGFLALLCWFSIACGYAQAPAWAWAKDAHTSAAEWANDIATDPLTGNIVAVGVFNSDLSAFYGNNFIGAVGGGFVAKYDSAGNVLWAFPIGNNQDDACNSVAVSPMGNIYVTGYMQNTADFKGTGMTPYVLNATGNGKEMYIAKYNSLGQLVWVNTGGGTNDDEGLSVTTNSVNIFVTGYYSNNGIFWGTSGGLATQSNQPNQNFYVTCYDANGNIMWLSDGGSGQSCLGRDVTADNNNVYVTGDYKGSTFSLLDYTGNPAGSLANAGSEDAFVLSIAATGPFNWLQGIHSSSDDFGRGIAQSASGVYLTGSTSSNATFPGYGSTVAPGAQGLDFFVAQVDRLTGNTIWVKSEPGNSDEEGNSIVVDTNNLVCATGYFESSLSFSGGPIITSTGNQDVFVAAYNSAGTFKWANTAGDNGVDIGHGISAYTDGSIYVCGEYENNAAFGSNVLTQDSPPNIFVAKIGCAPVTNNTIAASQTVCANQAPSTLTGSNPGGGSTPYTYLWQQSPNNTTWSAASGTNNTANYSPPPLGANTYYRRIVISSNACANSSTSSSILITVSPGPTPSNAGPNQSICTQTVTLSANTPTVGTGSWTVVSGSGTISNPNLPNTTVTGLSAGQNVFKWTITSGSCPPSVSSVTITVNAPPTSANAGPNQTICAATTTLAANTPTVGTGSWTVVSGGGTITSVNAPNSTVTGLSVGINVLRWTITNGSCPPSVSSVTITVNAPPTTSNAGNNQTICSSSVTLSGNTPSVGTGSWTVISGGGTVTSPNSPASTATGLSIGQNVFQWTISNGNCSPSVSTVTITVNAPPTTANAGSNQTICTSTATLAANNPTAGTGAWSVISGGGVVTSVNSPTSTVTGLSVGQNILQWTITNGSCPSSTSSITITVSAPPTTSNAGSNQTICASTTTLSANTPGSGTGTWSVVSGGGSVTPTNSPSATATGLNPGMHIFMWTISNGVCPSSTSTVSVLVDAMPTNANAGSNQNICTSTTTLSGNVPLTGNGTWSVVSGNASVNNTSLPNSTVSNLSAGQNIFMWTISNGSCPSSSDTVSIFVNSPSGPANAGPDQKICTGSNVVMNAVNPASGIGTWTVLSGSGIFSNPAAYNTSVSGLQTGSNSFIWTTINSPCPSSSDTVLVTVFTNPTVANAGPDQSGYSTTAVLNGNTPANGTGTWSVVSGSGSFSSATNPNAQVSGLDFGPNIIRWTISNGVCADSYDDVTITVSELNVPNGFSPNGDGINDNFEIPGLTQFGNVKLEVFNRWGNSVYQNSEYKNDWNGKNNSGEELSDDTYFFILDVTEKKTYKGYVVLKRK